MKDLLGNKIEVGDIVVRPFFSKLTKHKVVKIKKSGIVLSRYIHNYGNHFVYPLVNNNIELHNGTLTLYNLPDFIIIEKDNKTLDITKLKTLNEHKEELRRSKRTVIHPI